MQLNEHFIRRVIPEATFLSTQALTSVQFSVDTRTCAPGDIFIACTGEHADGHDFIKEALEKGAAGIFCDASKKSVFKALESSLLKNKFIVLFPDVKKGIIELARAWRAQFTYPVVAITGSVGKTSTKETCVALCKQSGKKYVASPGNQNTQLGLAMNILRMTDQHEVAIFELGINKRGEMAKLAGLAKPTIGVITNIGHSHMEGLGSIADIAAEKRDIFKWFKEDNIGIINGDQPLLSHVAYHHPVIKFGAKTVNQIQARKVQLDSDGARFVLKMYGKKYTVGVKKNHTGAVFNALATAAVGHLLSIDHQTIVDALEKPIIVPGRFEQRKLKKGSGALIHDAYNANPESMKAALLALEQIETKAHKVAVIGDMLELGVNSPFWHRQLGRFLRKVPSLRDVILVGSQVAWTKKTVPVGVDVELVEDWQQATELVQKKVGKDSLVLVKGSRGVGLDNLVHELT